jgi:hypothetical protein
MILTVVHRNTARIDQEFSKSIGSGSLGPRKPERP